MSPTVEQALQNLHDLLRSLGKVSHRHPADHPKAIRMFINLFEADEKPHPDDVRHWATNHGWSERDAHDLGEMCDNVRYTMMELGRL